MKLLTALLLLVLSVARAMGMDLVAPVSPTPTAVDATPAFDAAASAICASATDRTLRIPVGRYVFLTQPQEIPCALNLIGQGIGGTQLIRCYDGTTHVHFLRWVRGTDQNGGSVREMMVLAGCGTSGGFGINVEATPDTNGLINSFNRHNFTIDNVIVGREDHASSWHIGIFLDGSRNPDGNPDSVPGIRGMFVSHTSVSSTTGGTIYLWSGRGINFTDVECYVPLAGTSAAVYVDALTQSVTLISRNCNGGKFGLLVP